jgi:hypothetical protein
VKFLHKILMLILVLAALYVPVFLVGKPGVINAVGLMLGIAMVVVAMGSTGIRTAFSGGEGAGKFYMWFAVGMAVLAGFTTLFVNSQLDALSSRPAVHAQVSMMPSVIWGGAAGFVLAAVFTWIRRRSA